MEPREAGPQWRGLVEGRGHVMGHPVGPELKTADLRGVQMDKDRRSQAVRAVCSEREGRDRIQMRGPV